MDNVKKNTKIQYEISLELKNLVNTDTFSKTDSQIRVFVNNVENNEMNFQGQTEVVFDSLNPKFVTKIKLENDSVEVQTINFYVYDTEIEELDQFKIPKLNENRYIGKCEINFVQMIKAKRKKLTIPLINGDIQKGLLLCHSEEIKGQKESYEFKLTLKDNLIKLNNIFLCFEEDRQKLNFQKEVDRDDWVKVQEAMSLPGNKYEVKVSAQQLTNCNPHRRLRMEMALVNNYDEETVINHAEFTIHKLKEQKNKNVKMTFNFMKDNQITHTIIFDQFDLIQAKSQQDYISHGLNISLQVGIDQTASNIDVEDPKSLHQVGNGVDINKYKTYNDYMKCLYSVVKILIEYDSDKVVPMYGFGLMKDDMLCNCYPMFGQEAIGQEGFDDLIEAQVTFTRNPYLQLFGPTNFAPVLNHFMAEINRTCIQNQQIFLIITDGWITDYQQTIDAIVQLSQYPVSLVIVGVGNGTFDKMNHLDDDQGKLRDSKGFRPMRDCVQFVNFNSVNNDYNALRREVMSEFPDQIINQFKQKEITPDDVYNENPDCLGSKSIVNEKSLIHNSSFEKSSNDDSIIKNKKEKQYEIHDSSEKLSDNWIKKNQKEKQEITHNFNNTSYNKFQKQHEQMKTQKSTIATENDTSPTIDKNKSYNNLWSSFIKI